MLLKEGVQKAVNVLPSKPNGFPRNERLRSKKDFELAYSGKRLASKFFILHYVFVEGASERKVGFTVSKKVSRLAVERNRLKRRLREIYRCNKDILPGNVFVIIRSLPLVAGVGFHEIQKELIKLFVSVASKKHSH